jgi:N-succinyldiaminopimelate aminotransferase
LRQEIIGRGLLAILASNPNNPIGKTIHGNELAAWVSVARELDCTLLLDEFYSHYIWTDSLSDTEGMSSAARYVEDVNQDPVVIFDGLTKNWRYPGWRCTWTVGPKSVIEAVTSVGSFLDGGGSRPLQRAAASIITPEHAASETRAIRQAFGKKREFMLRRTRALGMALDREPDGTFYIWARVDGLPESISDGMSFFRAAIKQKVITVPGEFFDVNPGKRRPGCRSRFAGYVRLSFGPDLACLEKGMDSLTRMIGAAR